MKLVMAALLSLVSTSAFAVSPYGSDESRSECIVALARSSYFSKAEHRLQVAHGVGAGFGWNYRLNENDIEETKVIRGPIWRIKDYLEKGDVTGRAHLQTIHAQLLLIAKAMTMIEGAQLSREDAAEIRSALSSCEPLDAFGPLKPDEPRSLFSSDKRHLGATASQLKQSITINLGDASSPTIVPNVANGIR
jgi:hypothetical protein